MKITDTVRMAQTNLVRSKLRTALTIIAVFIGSLTISLTNGVGNGVKMYVDQQLGNIGAQNDFIVQAKQDAGPRLGGSDVKEYDPTRKVGVFNIAYLGQADIEKISAIKGINRVTPDIQLTLDYVSAGQKKYVLSTQQYADGLDLQLEAGRTVTRDGAMEVTMPINYLKPLGFATAQQAIGRQVKFGFKNAQGIPHEQIVSIVGVQKSSLLGSGGWYLSYTLSKNIHQQMTAGVASLSDAYVAVGAQFDSSLTTSQIAQLKNTIESAGNYQAQTFQERIGTIGKVIDTVIIGLNIFGAIALLAASFGIVNTLLMAVNERTREIGLMKALGTSRRSIFALFSMEAISLGLWGSLLGVLMSMGIGAIVNPIATNTFLKDFDGFKLLAFPLWPSLGIIGLIMLIAFIAGALPSLKASRLNPIDALRYE
jgi:putative ABC transport system permease protein